MFVYVHSCIADLGTAAVLGAFGLRRSNRFDWKEAAMKATDRALEFVNPRDACLRKKERRRRRAPPTVAPLFELQPLEQRLLLNFAASVSGLNTATKNVNYVVHLAASGTQPALRYTVDWGD